MKHSAALDAKWTCAVVKQKPSVMLRFSAANSPDVPRVFHKQVTTSSALGRIHSSAMLPQKRRLHVQKLPAMAQASSVCC
jgi:hypothetical protein